LGVIFRHGQENTMQRKPAAPSCKGGLPSWENFFLKDNKQDSQKNTQYESYNRAIIMKDVTLIIPAQLKKQESLLNKRGANHAAY
jgi:hypothetical protein